MTAWPVETKLPAVAGKSYDVKSHREASRARSVRPSIPHCSNTRNRPKFFPKNLSKTRARIEQAFGKLKRFKRIALRCETTARNDAAFFALASGFILIKSVHAAWNGREAGISPTNSYATNVETTQIRRIPPCFDDQFNKYATSQILSPPLIIGEGKMSTTNRRSITRSRCSLRAKVNDGPETTIHVKMLDFASTGARIQLPAGQRLSKQVLLIFGENKIQAECVWQNGNEAGLSFERRMGNASNASI